MEEVGEGSTSVGKEGNKVEEGSEGKNKVEENPGNGWKEVSMEKVGKSPKSQLNQVIITTPSRYEALSNADEFGFEIDKDEIEEMEEDGVEIAEDLCQSRIEESVGGKLKENKRGKSRQTLPRQSKTNHRVGIGRGSSKNL